MSWRPTEGAGNDTKGRPEASLWDVSFQLRKDWVKVSSELVEDRRASIRDMVNSVVDARHKYKLVGTLVNEGHSVSQNLPSAS